MEAIGTGLESIGNAISTFFSMSGVVSMTLIAALALLIYFDKITLDEVKELLPKKGRRY